MREKKSGLRTNIKSLHSGYFKVPSSANTISRFFLYTGPTCQKPKGDYLSSRCFNIRINPMKSEISELFREVKFKFLGFISRANGKLLIKS